MRMEGIVMTARSSTIVSVLKDTMDLLVVSTTENGGHFDDGQEQYYCECPKG